MTVQIAEKEAAGYALVSEKRKAGAEAEAAPAKKGRADAAAASPIVISDTFRKGTTEFRIPAESANREYIVRFITDPVSNSYGTDVNEDWPTFVPRDDSDPDAEDDEGEPEEMIVCGAVWTTEGLLVGVVGMFEGDGHNELYGRKEYQHIGDLESFTARLCGEVDAVKAWELEAFFDAGQGIDREVTLEGQGFANAAACSAFKPS